MADDDLSAPDPEASAAEPTGVPAAPAREPDMEMLERVEGELADVELVLTRIDDGTYGTCEVCGDAIPDERLAESPAARFCAAHSA